MRFTDENKYFVSEASVYRLLKAHDLITSPAYVVIKAAKRVQGQDLRHQPDLADGLHLPQDHWRGLVLLVDGIGRLLALHRGVAARPHYVRFRRHGHTRPGPGGIWASTASPSGTGRDCSATMARPT